MFYDVNFLFFSLNLTGDMTMERWSPSPFTLEKLIKSNSKHDRVLVRVYDVIFPYFFNPSRIQSMIEF